MSPITTVLTPQEGADAVTAMGIKKTGTPLYKTFLLGVMGGIFIAFGTMGLHVMTGIFSSDALYAMGKFLGAAVFPTGLMLVVLIGGELYTGNTLAGLAVLHRKVKPGRFGLNLMTVWLGNLCGSVFAAAVALASGLYAVPAIAEAAVNLANHKVHLNFSASIASGFLCNMLVALAIWAAASISDGVGKIMAIWFPIMLFIACGFQHVVANMYIFSVGFYLNAGFGLGEAFTALLAATIGNTLSGALFLPVMYYLLFQKKEG
jgi:formate/nitrite transporter